MRGWVKGFAKLDAIGGCEAPASCFMVEDAEEAESPTRRRITLGMRATMARGRTPDLPRSIAPHYTVAKAL